MIDYHGVLNIYTKESTVWHRHYFDTSHFLCADVTIGVGPVDRRSHGHDSDEFRPHLGPVCNLFAFKSSNCV